VSGAVTPAGVARVPRGDKDRVQPLGFQAVHATRGSGWAVLGAAAALLLAVPATADEKVLKEADRTVFKKRTVIDFSEVAVEGELSRPEGSYSVSKKKATFKSLVKVRDTLIPELQKSAEHL